MRSYRDRIAELEAEVERLRQALEDVRQTLRPSSTAAPGSLLDRVEEALAACEEKP
jgi:uncharacterized protein YukE